MYSRRVVVYAVPHGPLTVYFEVWLSVSDWDMCWSYDKPSQTDDTSLRPPRSFVALCRSCAQVWELNIVELPRHNLLYRKSVGVWTGMNTHVRFHIVQHTAQEVRYKPSHLRIEDVMYWLERKQAKQRHSEASARAKWRRPEARRRTPGTCGSKNKSDPDRSSPADEPIADTKMKVHLRQTRIS